MIVRILTIVQEFIKDLDKLTFSKVYEDIDSLKEFGKKLGMPYSRKIGKNLYELRTLGKIHVRLLYGFEGEDCYIVDGFLKKTNKIPKKEIEIAEARLKQLAD